MNNKHAFNYKLSNNNFTISNLSGKDLIKGEIRKKDDEWSSIIDFLTIDKKFSNKKIIGRTDLILELTKSNIILEDFTFDNEKLIDFVNKNNEFK